MSVRPETAGFPPADGFPDGNWGGSTDTFIAFPYHLDLVF